MNISKLKIAWKYITGGIDSVVEYLLLIVNAALAQTSADNKTKIQATINTIQRVVATLESFRWLCPTKWQTAYKKTTDALKDSLQAISDLEITKDDIDNIRTLCISAVFSWRAPDGETEVDCESCKDTVTTLAILLVAAVALTGCTYKGAKITEGTDLAIGMNIPGTDGAVQINFLNYLSGFRVAVAKDANVAFNYKVIETNSYFGCVTTTTQKEIENLKVEPCETTTAEKGVE